MLMGVNSPCVSSLLPELGMCGLKIGYIPIHLSYQALYNLLEATYIPTT